MQRVLLLTYYFPPSKVVSARRWAKLSKYLLKSKSIDFRVLSPNLNALPGPWDEDVLNVRQYVFNSKYPRVLELEGISGLLNKALYKFWDFYLGFRYKGTKYDRAINSEKEIIKKLVEIRKDFNFDCLITSGPPHRLSFIGSEFCSENNDIMHIIDMRDPWTLWSQLNYQKLNKVDSNFENQMEFRSFNSADLVLFPTSHVKRIYEDKYVNLKNKFVHFPHSFDPDDFINQVNTKNNGVIKLIIFGTLYENIENYIALLSAALKALKQKGVVFELNIYSGTQRYKQHFIKNELDAEVKYHDIITAKKLIFEIQKSDAAIIFKRPDFGKDNLSTKYFDVINCKTPIVLIGPKGYVAEVIEKSDLGYSVSENEILELLPEIIRKIKNQNFSFNFNLTEYSSDYLASKLENLINEKHP